MIKILLIISICLIYGALYAQQIPPPTIDTGLGIAVPTGVGGGGVAGAIVMYLIQYFKGKKQEESLLLTKMTEVHDYQKDMKEDLDERFKKMGDCLTRIWSSHEGRYKDEQIPPPV